MNDESKYDEADTHENMLTILTREGTPFGVLPLFSLEEEDRRRKHVLNYETEITVNDEPGTFKWQVSADPSYGFPDAFDRKVFKILENLALQQGLPLKNPIHFSLYQVLQALELPPFGVHFARVRSSVQRVAAVKVHTHFTRTGGEKTELHSQTFHIYDDVTFQEESFGNEIGAGNHYITFGDWYLESLNQQYIRPVDLQYFHLIQNPISSRLCELLTLKFEAVFQDMLLGWQVPYADLCNMIPLREAGWMSSPQRQLESVHDELISTDFLDRVEWMKSDRGWSILYVPGQRAHNAYRALFDQDQETQSIADDTSPEEMPHAVDDIRTAAIDEPELLTNEAPVEEPKEPVGTHAEDTAELDEDAEPVQEEADVPEEDTTPEEEPEPATEYEAIEDAVLPEEPLSQESPRFADLLSDEPSDIESPEEEVVPEEEEIVPEEDIAPEEPGEDTSPVEEQTPEDEYEAIEDTVLPEEPGEDTSVEEIEPDETAEGIPEDAKPFVPTVEPESIPVSETIDEGETALSEEVVSAAEGAALASMRSSSQSQTTSSGRRGETMFGNGEQSLCNIKYHMAWTTRSRHHILNDEVALRSREMIRDICAIHEAKIDQGVVAPDYIYIQVSCPPTVTPCDLMADLRERTLNTLQAEFPALQEHYWGRSIWSVGYMCVTAGTDTETQLNQYLESQSPSSEEDETFQVISVP